MNAAAFLSRLSTILAALAALVAARLLHHPTLARHIIPLWTYLRHLPDRVERALTRPPAPSRPRPSRAGRHRASPAWRLPTSPAWLVRVLGSEAACYASQLRYLLAEPEAKALLAASPAAGRRLAPLLHALTPSERPSPHPRRAAPSSGRSDPPVASRARHPPDPGDDPPCRCPSPPRVVPVRPPVA